MLTVLIASVAFPLHSPIVAYASGKPWYEVKEHFQGGSEEEGSIGTYTLKVYLHGICAEGGSFGLAYDTGLMTMSAIQGFSPFVPLMGSGTGGEGNPYVQDDRQEGFHTFLWLAAVDGSDRSLPGEPSEATSGGIDGTVSGGALLASYQFAMSNEGFASLTDTGPTPSVRVKTWTDTPLSKPADTTSSGSISLANMEEEIWRRDAAEAGGGFYQVVPIIGTGAEEAYQQEDIRFVYSHGGEAAEGTIRSYDPKKPVELKLYKKSEEGGGYETSPQVITLPVWDEVGGDSSTLTGNGIGTGQYTHKVALSVTSPGLYKVEVHKEGHLGVVIAEADFSTGTASLPAIELIPGDLNSDGRINQGDRVILLAYVHHTLPVPELPEEGEETSQERQQFERADINGDGKVNLADLNILMYRGYYLQEEGSHP